jgi:hypothetical protein
LIKTYIYIYICYGPLFNTKSRFKNILYIYTEILSLLSIHFVCLIEYLSKLAASSHFEFPKDFELTRNSLKEELKAFPPLDSKSAKKDVLLKWINSMRKNLKI